MMKFITEEYLRDLFRKEPFDTYKLNEGQRLTPGARQYLSDKRIELQDDVFQVIKKASKEDFEKNKKAFQGEEAKVLSLESSRA
ncbi:MAG: cobalamin adenosyltransferase, partial [Clostridium sp.]